VKITSRIGIRRALLIAGATLVASAPLAHAATMSSSTTVSLGAHVTFDTATGTYYCFGHKANVVGTGGDDEWYAANDHSPGMKVTAAPTDALVMVLLDGNDDVENVGNGAYICTG